MKSFYLFLFLMMSLNAAQAQVRLEYSFGFPQVKDPNEKPQVLTLKNAKDFFNKDFKLTTSGSDFVKLNINNNYELNIFDNSELNFVLIRDDMSTKKESERDWQVYKISLISGQILMKRLDDGARALSVPRDLRLESQFFEWDLIDKKRSSLELMISMNPSIPQVRFCNARPDYSLKLFDHEKEIDLKGFQQITFVGVLEKERVGYDLLLRGKKIPKGSWGKVSTCSFSELTEKETAFRLQQEKRQRESIAAVAARKKIKADNDAKFLCHEPYGQFNDCQWKTEVNTCVRYRCNADGKWTSRTELTKNQNHFCRGNQRDVKSYVAQCNY